MSLEMNALIDNLKKSLASRPPAAVPAATNPTWTPGTWYSARYKDYLLRSKDGGRSWRVFRPSGRDELVLGNEPLTLDRAKQVVDFDLKN